MTFGTCPNMTSCKPIAAYYFVYKRPYYTQPSKNAVYNVIITVTLIILLFVENTMVTDLCGMTQNGSIGSIVIIGLNRGKWDGSLSNSNLNDDWNLGFEAK